MREFLVSRGMRALRAGEESRRPAVAGSRPANPERRPGERIAALDPPSAGRRGAVVPRRQRRPVVQTASPRQSRDHVAHAAPAPLATTEEPDLQVERREARARVHRPWLIAARKRRPRVSLSSRSARPRQITKSALDGSVSTDFCRSRPNGRGSADGQGGGARRTVLKHCAAQRPRDAGCKESAAEVGHG